ncbi:MAG: TonB-dependent receptor, partial [Thermomonas sp.]|uniref:TonB-dependent receptor n=1 Tax=Thermomonas sp. TaxID=1971895 RepID=UPI0039E4BD88
MNRTSRLRKSALCLAMGVCLSSLALAPAFAQSAMGAVAGRANAGDQITLVNTATGATRTVTVNADGSYRLAQLPVGDYTLQVKRGGSDVGQALTVSVPLGGTATVNLGSEGTLTNLDAVQVVGSRVVNRVDVYSTESATNISREEWARLPVDQGLAAVALLAPGVIGNNRLGGLNFNGSSMAENVVYINGMNVTDPFYRSGFSSVPFGFYKEFQVKTGGYSAEFGRSTGGVINAVTRSGGNEFHGGIEVTMEPAAWQAPAEDRYHEDGSLHTSPGEYGLQSRDSYNWFKTNVWASGPIVKDRLFFFGMYEDRSNHSRGYSLTSASQAKNDNGFWGTKLDWIINDNHKLELLAFSDGGESESDGYVYTWATDTMGAYNGTSYSKSGGDNYSATYTGHFGENFTAKALYGVNNRSSHAWTTLDAQCSPVTADASYSAIAATLGARLGCHPNNGTISKRDDEREMGRLDFEWSLGNHVLRFGYDRELMTSETSLFYPGDGFSYQAVAVSPGSPLANGATVPAGVNAIITKRFRSQGGTFETEASAFYVEDNWNVTPNLLLSLGVRVDSFDNKTASGQSFIKLDNLVAPRLGFSWDMQGDGTSKLFGNAGRYYLPVTNAVNEYAGSDVYDEYYYYVLQGWNSATNPVTGAAYMSPILGAQIGGVYSQNNVGDPRAKVDRDIKAVYQDEFILGYQKALNATWSWGVNATYRIMERTLDDVGVRV